MFALAKVSSFGLFGFKNDGRKTCAFVIAIAKRLVLRMPTRAVCVFLSGFKLDLLWKAGSDFGFVHVGIHPVFFDDTTARRWLLVNLSLQA